jgi:hypothetical protein
MNGKMKIKEKGTRQTHWEKEFECTGIGNDHMHKSCGALLIIEEEDLFITSFTNYGGDRETFITFQCIQCGSHTDVAREDVPEPVRRSIPSLEQWKRKQNDK